MILANAFGAFIITFCIDVVHSFQKTEEHERQISSELNIANSIQNDMLPAIFPDFPERKEFSLAAKMTPAKEVGGDFYDFFFVDSDHFAILIGDVSGKGVPAALFMVISKTILKNDAQAGLSPCQVLTKANKDLCEGNKESMFVTVWLGVYEISTGKLTYANGGHNPPLIKQGNGDYHTKNVMLQNGEVLLIDMDTLSVGYPTFKFASMYLAFMGFGELDHQKTTDFMGLPYELVKGFFY